jgi:hypothetical protein
MHPAIIAYPLIASKTTTIPIGAPRLSRQVIQSTFYLFTVRPRFSWFSPDYYYPARLGPFKKAVAGRIDATVARKARKSKLAGDQ